MAVQLTGKPNPDLANERKKCTFEIEEMARWWHGGDQNLAEKRERGNHYKQIENVYLKSANFEISP